MLVVRRVSAALGLVLLASSLSGCGSISSFVAGGMADAIPAWAGGLPADAPPRPGTAAYDAYLAKQRDAQNQATPGQTASGPAAPGAKAVPDPATSPSASAIH